MDGLVDLGAGQALLRVVAGPEHHDEVYGGFVQARNQDDRLAVGYSWDARPYTVRVDTCAPDAYEPDDTLAQAKPIVAGAGAQTRNLCSGRADFLSFAAGNGVLYRIETTLTGANVDTAIAVLDSSGATLASSSNDSGPGGIDERIDWTAPAAGTYYLRVTPETGGPWGFDSGYSVTLE